MGRKDKLISITRIAKRYASQVPEKGAADLRFKRFLESVMKGKESRMEVIKELNVHNQTLDRWLDFFKYELKWKLYLEKKKPG